MNKYGIIVGLAVAVIASGTFSVYAIIESGSDLPTTQDLKDLTEDIKEDIDDVEIGFGQVEKQTTMP